ncbi:MAG: ABC transporter substrate-binding protein [Candidatus Rokubacteria bacterium]|nr:ABC transporter substrate-binding protein [Candidatus Rokubacteria bacterium]
MAAADLARRRFTVALTTALAAAVGLFATPVAASAQGATKIPRVGVLRLGSPADTLIDAFREGLRELGYVEGRNVIVEYRWAEGREERLPELAADLVRMKMDVLVVAGNGPLLAATRATKTIPIVMPVVTDPVALGIVKSLARPGTNVTGLTSMQHEIAGKWIGLLKEAFPKIARVGLLSDPSADNGQVKSAETNARAAGIRTQVLTIRTPGDVRLAFQQAEKERLEALITMGSPLLYAQRATIVELAARHRLPVLYHHREFVVEAGGLMSYGTDFADLFRRSAVYVDKILKGARPADLPIQQPSKFELVVNLKTAKALGLTLPHSFLLLANEVIQ